MNNHFFLGHFNLFLELKRASGRSFRVFQKMKTFLILKRPDAGNELVLTFRNKHAEPMAVV